MNLCLFFLEFEKAYAGQWSKYLKRVQVEIAEDVNYVEEKWNVEIDLMVLS